MFSIQQYRSIAIKLNQRTIRATNTFCSTYNYCIVYLTLFNTATRSRILDTYLDNITNGSITSLGTTQYLDAHYRARTSIVSHI